MKTTFKLTNETHGTHAQVRLNLVGETILKAHTVKRIRHLLCPVAESCPCKQVNDLFGTGDFASAVWNGNDGSVVVTRVAAPVAPAAPVYTASMEAAPAAPVEAAPVEAAPVAPAEADATA
jgi:hypothetical protein